MQIAVTAKKMDLTPAIRSYAEEKISRLEKYFDGIMEAKVLLRVEKHRHIAEATLHAAQADFTGKEHNEDLYAAIDRLSDKLEAQVRKYKTRNLNRRRGRGAAGGPRVEELMDVGTITILGELDQENVVDHPVVQEKFIHLDRLTATEAISRMEVHGDDFWVYSDRDGGDLCVAYRRKIGGYGLIRSES